MGTVGALRSGKKKQVKCSSSSSPQPPPISPTQTKLVPKKCNRSKILVTKQQPSAKITPQGGRPNAGQRRFKFGTPLLKSTFKSPLPSSITNQNDHSQAPTPIHHTTLRTKTRRGTKTRMRGKIALTPIAIAGAGYSFSQNDIGLDDPFDFC